MSKQTNDFFQNNKDVIGKTHQAIDSASSTGDRASSITVPGNYIMRVKTLVAKKKDGTLLVSPNIALGTSVKTVGALQLHVLLETTEATEAVEKGSTVFNTITLAQAAGATDEKIRNTSSYMKPIICALIGKDRFDLTPDFVNNTLEIDYDEDTLKITRNHGLTQNVMVVCEQYVKQNGTEGISVKSIRALRPGDKSVSIKQAPTDSADLVKADNEIKNATGTVTVENADLEYDPKMDTSEFQVEDA